MSDQQPLETGDPKPTDASEKPKPAPAATVDRKPNGLRRVRTGIKLRARNEVVARNAISERWLRLVDNIFNAEATSEGLRYARLGQTLTLEAESGCLVAKVQGRRVKPYETRLIFGEYSLEQWERIIDLMAREAVYLVKLLADEVPQAIDELLGSLGLSLLPPSPVELQIQCTCLEAGPCKHAAAVAFLFAEQLSSESLSVFSLRGMAPSRLLDRLRHLRAIQARGVATAHVDPMIPESQLEPTALEDCVEEFWRSSAKLSKLSDAPPSQHVSHALLRRLGPSPLKGKFPLVGLLASVYDSVAEYAIKLRDQAEHMDEPGEEEDS